MKLTNEDRHENMSQDTSPPAGNENASQDPSPPASGANENASQDPPLPSTANENGSDGSSGSSPPSGTESENGSQDSPDSPHPSDTDTESEEDEIEGFISVALASRRGDVSDEEDDLPDPVEVETGMSVLDGSDRKVATGDLIQICGPSLIGKTQLLYALVASAIAPAPAGRGGHVRYFELNESIDAKRMKMLVANLCKDALDCSERELKEHVRNAMKRLVIYRANSTVQLCITLKSLLPFLETRAGQKGTFAGSMLLCKCFLLDYD